MGCAAGSLACALLVINNLRDIPTDREVGKRTLAVRLGDAPTRLVLRRLIVGAYRLRRRPRPGGPALLALVSAPLAVAPSGRARRRDGSGADRRARRAPAGCSSAFGVAATIGLALGS